MRPGEVFNVKVSSVNLRAAGIAKVDGMVVFIPGLLEGEQAYITIDSVEKNYALGTAKELLLSSPSRVMSDCPHYSKCGGCAFRHVTYEEEARIKQIAIKDALRRNGIHAFVNPTITASPHRSRNKVVFHFTLDGKIGFFEKNSHVICPVNDCLLLPTLFSDIAFFTETFFLRADVTPTYLYLRISTSGDITIVLSLPAFSKHISLLTAWQTELCHQFNMVSGVFLTEGADPETSKKPFFQLFGTPFLTDQVGSVKFRSSCYSFRQVNFEALELLLSEIRRCSGLKKGDHVVDLYCGTGTLGQFLASSVPEANVTGVEINENAIKDAKHNASQNGLRNIRYFCGDSAQYVKNAGKTDCAIIDPPRSGCTPSMIKELLSLDPKTIVYVSCNPDTLAKNLKKLTENYQIVSITPVDLFPRTSNVETVVLLNRSSNTHTMKLQPLPYNMIKSGEKNIELRLFDEKRQKIKVGDTIIFTHAVSGETISTRVLKLHRFDTFAALYRELPLLKCGYTAENLNTANPADMELYYSPEEQRKYGVIGIELSLF